MADRLQTAGRTPEHRYGRSWLYGQRLHEMLRDRMHSRRPSRAPTPFNSGDLPDASHTGEGPSNSTLNVEGPVETEKIGQNPPLQEEYDIANMSPDRVDKLLSEYTWFPLENTASTSELLDWESFFAV